MIRLFVLAILVFFGLRLWAVGLENIEREDGGAGPELAASYAHGGVCGGKCAPYALQNLSLEQDPVQAQKERAKVVFADLKIAPSKTDPAIIDESGKKKGK